MESTADLACSEDSMLRPTSPRTAMRSRSDEVSSASYPQVLIAVRAANRVSLVSSLTEVCANTGAEKTASSAAWRKIKSLRETALGIRKILPGNTGKWAYLVKVYGLYRRESNSLGECKLLYESLSCLRALDQ